MAKTPNKTKTEKSHTEEKQVNDSSKSLTWSIRDIDLETRMIIAKAAKLYGKTISQYIIDDVRAFAQSQITQTRQPTTSQDMDNINSVANLINRLEKLESKIDRPLWKKLFGS